MSVKPFSKLNEFLDEAPQAGYLQRYLGDIGCSTIVAEENYVDKGYLVDFGTYHSQAFFTPESVTTRLHFFSEDFSDTFLNDTLATGAKDTIERLRGAYLGFCVVRPPPYLHDSRVVGNTVLKTYDGNDGHDHRHFLTVHRSSTLYGIPLGLDSLPYQPQDIGVGACASAALWTATQALHDLFSTPLYSLAEITELSTAVPGFNRVFPSDGLTLMQMAGFIHSIGLETDRVALASDDISATILVDAVKAHLQCGLPVIAEIKLGKLEDEKGQPFHAVVISGYRTGRDGKISELYVHDDQIGPYSRTRPVENLLHWDNEWVKTFGYKQASVIELLIPVCPEIRLSFSKVFPQLAKMRETQAEFGSEYTAELFLTRLYTYKQWLLQSRCVHKASILTERLPRYIWVIRTLSNGKPLHDVLYDATYAIPRSIDIDIRYAEGD